ncbi:MAG: metallophosphoesterase [Methylobacteriaceae bacterium]|jgi:predicted MPP superfamily phosphohydrolase|nr:metallophosphoesterase [Methylobacteriaceae bacterium]
MMNSYTRRDFLRLGGELSVVGSLGGYTSFIEPSRLVETRYAVQPPRWAGGPRLTVAALADFHAGEHVMPIGRVASIVDRANAVGADMILLLGDYTTGFYNVPGNVAAADIARELKRLSAPFGVYAIIGNHEWWTDEAALQRKAGPTEMGAELLKAGIPVLANQAVRLEKDGKAFWLAGLDSQWAYHPDGAHDLPATLAMITDDAPVLMLAHEPDIFPDLPEHIALTLSGHTHGGQVRLFGWSPILMSKYGNRYIYGHVVEGDKHLIVSGGLGTVGLGPVDFDFINSKLADPKDWAQFRLYPRLGVPPEIVVVQLDAPA